MARSKGVSYGRLLVKNLHTINVSSRSQNPKILKDTTRCHTLPIAITAGQARRSFSDLSPPPPPPPTSTPGSSSWYRSKWSAGIAVSTTIISFLQFKEDVDFAMETAEEIIDAVEVMAEAVDKVAEKIVDDFPDGSKLKTTVEMIEDVAESVAGKAQKAVDFIDEVQEAEKKLNPVIEPVKQLAQVAASEAS